MLNGGDVFAGFTIERLLGQGGMGSVYLARHPRLGKLTALKLLNRELYADTEIRARFEREADLVARLDHPNIVEVYDRGTENEMLWISMQYVDGVDAAGVNVATLPPERAVQVIEGVADALDYAHGMGVLHRDVKPANIILARAVAGHGERVFLTDFGIARLREDSTHLTQAGMFTATLAYASPEQMTGAHLDPTTDQYSLACALYWLLIGVGPFDSPHPGELIRGHLQLLPPPVSLRRPGLSPAMDAVLTKAMAKRPADRFPTCTDFAKAARRALSGPPAQHPTYPNPPAPQPNYAQPYPAPPYQAPPAAYPPSAVPANQQPYPVPPSAAQPPPAAPNFPAPQPVAPNSPQPAAAPNYPASQPQSGQPVLPPPVGPAYPVPPPSPAGPSAYPAPAQPAAPVPPVSQDADRVGSGPTVRPYPQVPESAAAGCSAPPQSAPAGAPSFPGYPPQAAGQPEVQVQGPSQPGGAGHPAAQQVPGRPPSGTGDQVGSGPRYRPQPSGDEVWQRPTDVVPQPVVSAAPSGEEPEPVVRGVESASESSDSADLETAVEDSPTAVGEESGSTGGDAANRPDDESAGDGVAEHAPETVVRGEDEAGGMSRHPDSGAFVPAGANQAAGGAVRAALAAEFVVAEPVSSGAVERAVAGPVGMPGHQGFGPPPFGVGPVRPPAVPAAGQRAGASQATALVVLGLAVLALVLLVAVAVVVVSG
ncbi:protein kinase [Nocardia sp. NPDC059764]|uniref:serine/threonine-protein kinase n=1 Tax=Nocardia sp. NPDC059764 TaxID=3346939 RepID=UPI0036468884